MILRKVKQVSYATLCLLITTKLSATEVHHQAVNTHAKKHSRTQIHKHITHAQNDDNRSRGHGHDVKNHQMMHGMLGSYPYTRENSGTNWLPQSTPSEGYMQMTDNGMWMVSGYMNFIFDHQGGPRGGDLAFTISDLMFMAQKDIEIGTVGLKTMFSLDPIMGKGGYPLILQTGETANGRTPLIDRQHPHDFFGELALVYSVQLGPKNSAYIYVGLPGEPALGPPSYSERWVAEANPEAPISHHWFDSTHISFGVVTLGVILDTLKLETSWFNGRESDQFRWNIESPQLNSQSVRLTYNPTPDWSIQISYGRIKSPEELEPAVNTKRYNATLIYNRPLCNDGNLQIMVAWGLNRNFPGHTLNAYLLESALNLRETHTFYGRLERVQKDELFAAGPPDFIDKVFTVNKLSLGYLYEFSDWHHAKPGVGFLVSTYYLPRAITPFYGHQPFSYMIYGRLSID